MDRDINQINILLSQGNIAATKDLYRFGRNMMVEDSNPISLSTLAQELEFNNDGHSGDANRLYKMFEEYYGDNPSYADKLMGDGFVGTKEKLQVAIPRILQTIVAPHFALRASFEAADLCGANSKEASIHFDKGVAVLIGSLEGAQEGGSDIGLSWFSLTKEFCSEFNCDNADNPKLNVNVMNHLENAKTAIKEGKCTSFISNIKQMESLLLVPIIQGLLYYAKMREDNPTMILNYEAAKVFAQAIVPIVKKVSIENAVKIESNILNNIGDPIKADEVWSAILEVLDDGSDKIDLGVKCADIGKPTVLNGEAFCDFSPMQ